MLPKKRLIVALDVNTFEEASKIVNSLSHIVDIFKVGIDPYIRFGSRIIDEIHKKGKKVFLDLKLHDIPNTIYNGTNAAIKQNVFMLNFHCLGGENMLKEAVRAVNESTCTIKPLLIGVTVLTSTTPSELNQIGINKQLDDLVIDMATMTKKTGLNGVVASAKEARKIKQACGNDFLVVTPGIRPAWTILPTDDQKRIQTPAQALSEGADYLVIGRPIIKADDPVAATEKVIFEMEQY